MQCGGSRLIETANRKISSAFQADLENFDILIEIQSQEKVLV